MVFFDGGCPVKIVRINHKYREYLMHNDEHFQHEGIGVLVQSSGNFYFLPITSKVEDSLPNHHAVYKTEIVFDRKKRPIATIKIRDYYLIDQILVTLDIETDPLIQQEVIHIRKNKKAISNKVEKMLINSRRRHKRVVKLYEGYYKENSHMMRINRAFGLRYFNDAIKSMSIVEGVNITSEHIEKIIKYDDLKVDVSDVLDSFALKTVLNLKYAWDEVMSKLDNSVTLEYIININAIIARDEALEIGKLRNKPVPVSGKYMIDPPDEKKMRLDIQRFTQLRERHKYEQDILGLYLHLIVSQPFYDGNKRTAFLIANHLLISLGIGILIIKDENLADFNHLLDAVYASDSQVNKNNFIKFLMGNCIIFKND